MIDFFLSYYTKFGLIIATIFLYNYYRHLYTQTPTEFQTLYEKRPEYCGRNYKKTWMEIHFGNLNGKGKKIVVFLLTFLVLKYGGKLAFALYVILVSLFLLFHVQIVKGNILPLLQVKAMHLSSKERRKTKQFVHVYNLSRVVMLLNFICILTNILY